MEFLNLIDELYKSLFEPRNSICRNQLIKRCKYFLKLKEEESLGDYYYRSVLSDRKGVVYTPETIASYMINITLENEIIKNPFLKILDPSCGCGHILMNLFKYLREVYINNLQAINESHGLKLNLENLNEHIVKNNIYGIDIDKNALKILSIELFYASGCIEKSNLINKDFLTDELDFKFDVIIGNPPYIGTKSIDKTYSNRLRQLYPQIYSDKGDISYCFFEKATECVNDSYKITFITSRYFMESLSGSGLRSFLTSSANIELIVDFYGSRPFRGAGIDPVIIFLNHKKIERITVKRPIAELKKFDNVNNKSFNTIFVRRGTLGADPWRLQEKTAVEIMEVIEKKNNITLGELCDSYQGIITGCDKAFIVDKNAIEEWNIEKEVLRPWIKSSSIRKEGIAVRDELFIIYSNIIKDEKDYPNALAYIERYRERLQLRRECRSGRRKWYELQWGRNEALFEGRKLIFPYKCEENRFAVDKGSYFSADVYSLVIKNDYDIDYINLQLILNSQLYEFYFKCFAKKLGGKLYEYYPNNLNRLSIPLLKDVKITSEEDLFYFYDLTSEQVSYVKNLKRRDTGFIKEII